MYSSIVIVSSVVLITLTVVVKYRQKTKLEELVGRGTSDLSSTSTEQIVYGGFGELFPAIFGAAISLMSYYSMDSFIEAQTSDSQKYFGIAVMILLGVVGPWAFAYRFLGEVFLISDKGVKKSSPFSHDSFLEWNDVTRVGLVRNRGGGIVGISLSGKDQYGKKKHFQMDLFANNISPFFGEALRKVPPGLWAPHARKLFEERTTMRLPVMGPPGTMIFCENCGGLLSPAISVCPTCGRRPPSAADRRLE